MRLFIGLPLSEAAAENTSGLAQRCALHIPGRYSLPENYHMTLAFLGEVPAECFDRAADALCAFAAQFPAPRITLEELSHFRQPGNAVLIRRVSSPNGLAAMHAALLSELDARGLPRTEGPFSPHVTLARHADITCADLNALSAPSVSFTAPDAALYLSARDETDTLRYTPLVRAAFQVFP